MKPVLRFSLTLAIAALAGCGGSGPSKYFPLGRGDHWDYALTEANALATNTELFTVDDAGTAEREGGRHYLRRTSNGTEYWIKVDDGNIERVATRTAVEYVPRDDPSNLRVLPVAPKAGDSWSFGTQPYILERALPFRERFAHDESLRFELHMKVESLDESVTVPAGSFEHCLKVEGEGRFFILADARIGASEVPVTQTEWYAPDVGLVKLVRSEALDTANIVGGTVTMELSGHSR
jgi:hypothetical protein